MAMRGREDQASRLGSVKRANVSKLTDSQKEELTISFATDPRGCAAQQKPLSAVSWSFRLRFCRIAASSKPRGSMTRLTSKVDVRPDRTNWEKRLHFSTRIGRKSSFAAKGLTVAERSKAQICQATLQEVGVRSKAGSADISSWAAREMLWAHGAVKWPRQLDGCVCAFGACQGCQTDQCK